MWDGYKIQSETTNVYKILVGNLTVGELIREFKCRYDDDEDDDDDNNNKSNLAFKTDCDNKKLDLCDPGYRSVAVRYVGK